MRGQNDRSDLPDQIDINDWEIYVERYWGAKPKW